jgi:hypothetical protein
VYRQQYGVNRNTTVGYVRRLKCTCHAVSEKVIL